MPSPRHSNVERRRERDNCRLTLSRYIMSAEASEESANLILSPSSSKLYTENEQLRTENLSLSQQVQQLSDALEKETEQKLTV
ncbi:hypothetical protein MY5147_004053, partial [Beauveria neobassiana]